MKYLYFVLGLFCFGLGAIGIFLPLLPATLFFLAASFCFARSSKRLYHWLIHASFYQKHLNRLITTGEMTRKSKITILACVTPFLLLAFFMMHNFWGRITIIILLLVKYYVFLFLIPTAPEANKPPGSFDSLALKNNCEKRKKRNKPYTVKSRRRW